MGDRDDGDTSELRRYRPVPISCVEIEKLAKLQVSQRDMAGWFNVSERTLKARLANDQDLRAAYERGRATAAIGLKRQMYNQAMSGDVKLQIHLSKHMLGMRDNLTIHRGPDLEDDIDPVAELLDKLDEIEERRREGS